MDAKQEIIDYWMGRDPSIYEMLRSNRAEEIDAAERPEILSYLPSFKDLRVLDLASGIGRFTGEFAKTAAHVTAVDLVPQFIAQNQENNKTFSNIAFLCSDARDLDFPKQSFDLIFISWLLMYLEERELEVFLLRLHKWVKKGGYLFFREACSASGVMAQGSYRAYYRSLHFYEKWANPLFHLVRSGSIQAYIDQLANPFICYWLYTQTTSRIGNMPRRRPEFESGLADAEAAQLE